MLSTASSLPVARNLAHWPNSIRQANSIIQDKAGNLVNIMSEAALAAAMESMMKELQDLKGLMNSMDVAMSESLCDTSISLGPSQRANCN